MGFNPRQIHEALAAQIKANIDKDWNVAAFPYSAEETPCIEVWPGGEYVRYLGELSYCAAQMAVMIRIDAPAADAETIGTNIADALADGDGHGSSIRRALMLDPTLGGVVQNLIVRQAEWSPNDTNRGTVAFIPVEIYLNDH